MRFIFIFFLKYILLLQLRPISLRYILRCLKPLDFLIIETYKCTLWRCFQKRVVRTKLDIYVYITYWCLLCGRICVHCEEFEDTKGWGVQNQKIEEKTTQWPKEKGQTTICKTYNKVKDNRCLHRKLCCIADKMSSELEVCRITLQHNNSYIMLQQNWYHIDMTFYYPHLQFNRFT